MKLPQKASFEPETREIISKVWFLASGFCLLRLGEPLSAGYPKWQLLVKFRTFRIPNLLFEV